MVSSCKFEQIMIQIFKICHKYHLCPTIVHQSKTTLVFALLASCRTLGLRVSFCVQPLAVSCLPDNGQKQVGGSEDIGVSSMRYLRYAAVPFFAQNAGSVWIYRNDVASVFGQMWGYTSAVFRGSHDIPLHCCNQSV